LQSFFADGVFLEHGLSGPFPETGSALDRNNDFFPPSRITHRLYTALLNILGFLGSMTLSEKRCAFLVPGNVSSHGSRTRERQVINNGKPCSRGSRLDRNAFRSTLRLLS
jgi:hypothetical protein